MNVHYFPYKTEVAGTITMTLPCRVRVLLRNLISHPSYFPHHHQIPMAHSMEWSLEPPHYEQTYDRGGQTKLFWTYSDRRFAPSHIPFCDELCYLSLYLVPSIWDMARP